MQLFKILFLLSIITTIAQADVKRISSVYKDLGLSQKIYLHAGLISVLEFPQGILEVRLGNPKSIKAQLSQVSPRELTLYLSQQNVEPTNLIVKSEKRFYIFDIIPSKTSHQDYVKIAGGYGSPVVSTQGTESRFGASTQGTGVRLAVVIDPNKIKKPKPAGRLTESVKLGGE